MRVIIARLLFIFFAQTLALSIAHGKITCENLFSVVPHENTLSDFSQKPKFVRTKKIIKTVTSALSPVPFNEIQFKNRPLKIIQYLYFGLMYSHMYTFLALTPAGLAPSDHILTQSDYIARAEVQNDYLNHSNSKKKIDLLFETTPFPHLAVRIDNHVYSYGVQRLNIVSVDQYFEKNNPNAKTDGSFDYIYSSLSQLSRVTNFVEIELPLVEVQAFQRKMRASQGNFYRNATWVNDCASMLNFNLEETTSFNIPSAIMIDTSPSLFYAYLALKKQSGDRRIKAFGQIHENEETMSSFTNSFRNLWIHSMETKFWATSFTIHTAFRGYLDRTNTNLEFQSEGYQKELKKLEIDFKYIFREQPEYLRIKMLTRSDDRNKDLILLELEKLRQIVRARLVESMQNSDETQIDQVHTQVFFREFLILENELGFER